MRVKFYRDRRGNHRWTIYAKNGRKVANAGQGYSRRIDAVRGFGLVTRITFEDGRWNTDWPIEGL
jgi:uncharacterized protein YegP (UPF0339 family)